MFNLSKKFFQKFLDKNLKKLSQTRIFVEFQTCIKRNDNNRKSVMSNLVNHHNAKIHSLKTKRVFQHPLSF